MARYVCGLAFSEDGKDVALIQKKGGPKYVLGRYNGLGGKVELGEDSLSAMTREFREESGVIIPEENWDCFSTLHIGGNINDHITFYSAFTDDIYDCRTVEDEPVIVCHVDSALQMGYNGMELVGNLRYLIPMALDKNLTASALVY